MRWKAECFGELPDEVVLADAHFSGEPRKGNMLRQVSFDIVAGESEPHVACGIAQPSAISRMLRHKVAEKRRESAIRAELAAALHRAMGGEEEFDGRLIVDLEAECRRFSSPGDLLTGLPQPFGTDVHGAERARCARQPDGVSFAGMHHAEQTRCAGTDAAPQAVRSGPFEHDVELVRV